MHEIVSFSKDIEFKNMINKITSISLEHTLMLDDNSNIKGDFIVSGNYKMTAASQIENDFSYKIPVDIEVNDKYDLSNLVIDIDDFTYEVIDEEILRVNIDLLLDKLEVKEKLIFDEELDKKKDNERENQDELVAGDDLFMETDNKKELEIPIDIRKDNLEIIDESEDLIDTINDIKSCEKSSNITNSIDMESNNEELSEDVLNTASKINDDFTEDMDNLNKNLNNNVVEEPKINNNYVEEPVNTNATKQADNGPSLFSSFDSSNETYSTYSVYILRDGDSVESVISKYKTTREKLEEYNDLNELRIGTKIIIPSMQNE